MFELLKLYQGQRALPKDEGVPEGPQRKNHVVRPLRCELILGEEADEQRGLGTHSNVRQIERPCGYGSPTVRSANDVVDS